jgi:hypothetical protein
MIAVSFVFISFLKIVSTKKLMLEIGGAASTESH